MSFRCSKCKEAQAPGKRPNRVVVETREAEYQPNGTSQKKMESTYGQETVREEDHCDGCNDAGYETRTC